MKYNRTKNGIRNMIWGILNKFVNLLVPFFIRTILIKSLGKEYTGVTGLFTSILTVLNLAELGFSSAIVFNMYKPIAEDDDETVCALMSFYRKVYHIIGAFVLVCGLALIPFLKYFCKDGYPEDINIYVLYIIFLLNSAVSYFLFAYRSCILNAYQREDVISKLNIVLKLIMYVAQIFTLIVLRDCYAYVILTLMNTVATNLLSAYLSKKYYPQYSCKGNIKKEKKANIIQNIKGLMIGKVCLVSRNALDNIFVSTFLGSVMVTIYGNYYYIMNAVTGMMTVFMTSLSAGVGNSIATEPVEKNYKDMNMLVFIYAWVSGLALSCMFCLYQPFMMNWMKEEEMLLPLVDVILFCAYFYSMTMGDVRSLYATSAGLFWENRVYVIAETVTNLVLNYVLAKMYGIHGIIIATLLSILFINFVWGSAVLFKHYFKKYNVMVFYGRHLLYFTIAIIGTIASYAVTRLIPNKGWLSLIPMLSVCVIVPNIIFLLFYCRRDEFKVACAFIKRKFMKKE
ncbi:Membrane protein involved in the export of O-antigen and teichoic acid [Butyrivibrio hungatei]|uniref:Membrane protein involved in the export of O-antigen and teichoic acid n=1 Tax=Butyrivibrio hungatei TaxID=185008 RepID=A0A1G5G459_9FIRM|nr:oligosaccharide flippase family protein [Butyrivibrio hungatei]SCY46365.1 Membrane protein involved in the export of O-antigen and teichoic acid [Butyrivibrio hungatei]